MDGEIDGERLQELLENGEAPRIVDIRKGSAFRRGHIPGSVNVPFGNLPQRMDDLADADRVVTVCPHGKASVKAARLVGSYQDFEGRVESLAGGLDAWEGPIEADEESRPADAEGSRLADGEGSRLADDEGPAPF